LLPSEGPRSLAAARRTSKKRVLLGEKKDRPQGSGAGPFHPIAKENRQDFFFFAFTLMSIPGAICCNCSRPSLACLPKGPSGSSSTAF